MSKNLKTEIENIIKKYDNKKSAKVIDGLYRNPKEVIKYVTFNSLSEFVDGNLDEQGRIKPYYNITRYRLNTAVKATEFDVKDFQAEADHNNYFLQSMLIGKEAYQWAKEINFSKTLNEFTKRRAEYGSALVKITETDGQLFFDIPYWQNMLFDPANKDGVKIEVHDMTKAKLFEKRDVWDKEAVEDILEDIDESDVDSVKIYEVEGIFPNDLMEKGKEGYSLQLHYVYLDEDVKEKILYSEELKKSRYYQLDWEEVPNSALGRGVVEEGFQSQNWTNIAKAQESIMMELGSKLVLKSSDPTIADQNLSYIDVGQIIQTTDLQQVDLTPRVIEQLEKLFNSWENQYEKATNTFNAVTGEQLPSNTPLGSVQIQANQASSHFDFKREEAGIFWQEIFNEIVSPFLIKRIKSKELLTSEFTNNELKFIDNLFATSYANDKLFEADEPTLEMQLKAMTEAQGQLNQYGNKRTIKLPKDFWKNYKAKFTWHTTNEMRNKTATLQNLNGILTLVGSNPAILQDPALKDLFSKMIEVAGLGLSPVSLGVGQSQPQQQPTNIPANQGQQIINSSQT